MSPKKFIVINFFKSLWDCWIFEFLGSNSPDMMLSILNFKVFWVGCVIWGFICVFGTEHWCLAPGVGCSRCWLDLGGVNLEFFFLKRPALGCFPGLFWFKVWPRKLRRGLYDPKIFADLSGQYVDLIVSHLILFKLKIKWKTNER